jgi:hypothetical protein
LNALHPQLRVFLPVQYALMVRTPMHQSASCRIQTRACCGRARARTWRQCLTWLRMLLYPYLTTSDPAEIRSAGLVCQHLVVRRPPRAPSPLTHPRTWLGPDDFHARMHRRAVLRSAHAWHACVRAHMRACMLAHVSVCKHVCVCMGGLFSAHNPQTSSPRPASTAASSLRRIAWSRCRRRAQPPRERSQATVHHLADSPPCPWSFVGAPKNGTWVRIQTEP